MSEHGTWDSEWRALAEKELRGAPFASLIDARPDSLAIAPALGPGVRDEGLGDAPAARRAVVITDREEHLPLAREADGLWWRGSEPRAEALVHEPPGLDPIPGGHELISIAAAHEAGASPVTEVAIAIAAVVERFRASPSSEVRLAVAVGPELFVEMAKLRALRRLARRALAALDQRSVPVWIGARSSERSLARLDAPTNVVRTSIAAAAAMMGGADAVGVLPMDLLDGPSAHAARVARNVPLVLARESSLFAVDDPARGSFAIEDLTDRIARDAWELARRADGAALRARITADAEARRKAVRARRSPIVGVSKHPPLGAHPSERAIDARDASPFERARAAPSLPVRVVIVGPPSGVEARTAFVRELLEVGGFAIDDAARVAVVSAPDAAFGAELPAVLAGLREAGVRAFVAGKPGEHEGALRAAGAAGFVALGQDAIAFFDALRGAP